MKKLRVILVPFVCVGLVALAGGVWSAQAKRLQAAEVQSRVATADLPDKVATWLQTRFDETQQELEFLVILKEQANLQDAAALTTKAAKGRYVRAALWQQAQTTQAPLIAWLKEREIKYRSFYILNALWVKGSRRLANEIAARPEVARVEGNPLLSFTQPVAAVIEPATPALTRLPPTIEPGLSYIGATELWRAGFTGQGILIGGQDTGLDWLHPALQSHYRGNVGSPDATTNQHDYHWHDSVHSGGGDCGADALAPCDDNGHGTHTLGTTLGADEVNQIGVAPGAQFIACRNMDRGNGTPATYLECFEFMLAPYPVRGTPEQGDPAQAPDLTVNSWACPASEGCSPDTLRFAIEAQRAAGIMTIVSAGNGGPGCATVNAVPAHYEASYAVGAFDASTGDIARFSSRGPVAFDEHARVKPDISAPGVFVRSAYRNNGYAFLSGTSMAAPHVAGAIALLWSARPELKNQIALTESLLNEAATRVAVTDCGSTGTPNFVYGFGRLDIKAAYDLATVAVELAAHTINQNAGVLSLQVTALPALKWRAVSQATWLSLDGAREFTGNAALSLRVAENTAATARVGAIQVAARTLTITQAGVSPFAVSGRVVDANGAGLSRVTLTFSHADDDEDAPESVTTDEEGRWSQTGFAPGPGYRVIATRSRQAFAPASLTFSAPLTALNFTAVNRRIIVTTAVTTAR